MSVQCIVIDAAMSIGITIGFDTFSVEMFNFVRMS